MLEKHEIDAIVKQLKAELLPIGCILIYSSDKVPQDFLPCDGSELSKTAYSRLYDLIGGTWGETENTFFLPDLQGKFVRGWDKDGNVDPERIFGTFQEDSIQGHYHVLHMESNKTKKDGSHDHYIGYETLYFGTNTFSDDDPCKSLKGCSDPHELSYGDSSRAIHEHELPKIEVRDITKGVHGIPKVATETRPKNVALMFCIKVR